MSTCRLSCLLVSLLLALGWGQKAMAGGCGPRGCPAVAATQNVQPAPATSASSSHAFTAVGGSRVAEINLSPEGLAAVNAAGKEEPLPKGFVSAADRARRIAKETPLYGWPEDGVGRPLKMQSRYSSVARTFQNSRVTESRSQAKAVRPTTTISVAATAKAKSRN